MKIERKQKKTELEFSDYYTGFVIIAKELNSTEKVERGGHWFFSF